MSYQTKADRLHDKLRESLANIEPQLRDCQYIMLEMLSNQTEGHNDWNDDFKNNIINLQKIFFDFANSINKFL